MPTDICNACRGHPLQSGLIKVPHDQFVSESLQMLHFAVWGFETPFRLSGHDANDSRIKNEDGLNIGQPLDSVETFGYVY